LRRILPLMASPNDIAKLPRIKPGRRGALAQLLELQRMLVKDGVAPETTAPARAQAARAWCELEERKRIIRMRPKPKDMDVSKDRARRPRPYQDHPAFTEVAP